MVTQQLSPELTQPSVLVEIDPGPAMLGMHLGRHRPRPMQGQVQIFQNVDFTDGSSAPTPALRPLDHSAWAASGWATADSTRIETHAIEEEAVEAENAARRQDCVTTCQPSCSLALRGTSSDNTASTQTAVVGINHVNSDEDDGLAGAGPDVMNKDSPCVGLQQGSNGCCLTAASPSGDPVKSATGLISIAVSDFASVAARRRSCGGLKIIRLNKKHYTMRFKEDHNSNRGAHKGVCGKNVDGIGKNFVAHRTKNPCPCDQWTCQGHVSESGDSLTKHSRDKPYSNLIAGVYMSELYACIAAMNMITTRYDQEELLRVSTLSTELFLNLGAAIDSCLRMLLPIASTRAARVEQCTGKVHCPLDDPG